MTKSTGLKLDWDKPYGTIHGRLDDRPSALYEQDGFLFDGTGNVVLTKEEKAQQQAALEEQLAALKASTVTKAEPVPEPETPEPALVEVRDGETGEAEVKEEKVETKAKSAKTSGKGKDALPSLPE